MAEKGQPNPASSSSVPEEGSVHTCSLRKCSDREIKPTDGRVDVRAYAVSRDQLKGMQVEWTADGQAHFHQSCWALLTKSTKTTEKHEHDEPEVPTLSLSSIEREMIKDAIKTAEIHDSADFVVKEAKRVADMVRNSEYCCAFTGAGISTAAGIGDFRGIHGKWTDRDKQKEHGGKAKKSTEVKKGWTYQTLRPTYTHEAIQKLMEKGLIHYVISQNVDGLHVLSGIPQDKISELHGNTFVEKCEKCKEKYPRSYCVGGKATNVPPKLCMECKINHRTGRKCEKQKCVGFLMNTIINFGDSLENAVFAKAVEEASKADLFLCLGSTIQVYPADHLVLMGKFPTRLLICNRQKTPHDKKCYNTYSDGSQVGSRVFGDCDKFMKLLMHELLSPEELSKWEAERGTRMLQYDIQRKLTTKGDKTKPTTKGDKTKPTTKGNK